MCYVCLALEFGNRNQRFLFVCRRCNYSGLMPLGCWWAEKLGVRFSLCVAVPPKPLLTSYKFTNFLNNNNNNNNFTNCLHLLLLLLLLLLFQRIFLNLITILLFKTLPYA